MMQGKFVILILGLAIVGVLISFAAANEVPRMTKEQLEALLNDPDIVVLDVRRGKNWQESEKKIKGAVRENPKRFKSWAHKYSKEKTLVLYCA
jgi:rhodanese-related sulfurtransferase